MQSEILQHTSTTVRKIEHMQHADYASQNCTAGSKCQASRTHAAAKENMNITTKLHSKQELQPSVLAQPACMMHSEAEQ
jgi:hypothetical protein